MQGDTAVHTSLRLLPFVLVLIFTIIANGHMMSKFGYYIPWYFFGAAFELIAAVLMCMLRGNPPLFSLGRIDLILSETQI